MERHREVVLDIQVSRRPEIGRAEVCQTRVRFPLLQQDPAESITDMCVAGRDLERPLSQFASFPQFPLSLIEAGEIV